MQYAGPDSGWRAWTQFFKAIITSSSVYIFKIQITSYEKNGLLTSKTTANPIKLRHYGTLIKAIKKLLIPNDLENKKLKVGTTAND